MTNRNKKRPAGGYRPARSAGDGSVGAGARTAPPAPRRGLLDTLFAPRVPGATSMPRIRTSLARGMVGILSSPVLVIAPALVLLGQWLALLALGYQGPFAVLVNALAIPPVGTSVDANLATSVFGLQGGLVAILVFVLVRAVIQALLTSLIVESLDTGRVSGAGLRRGMRIIPVTLAVNITGMGLLTVASFLGPLLGAGFQILIQVGVLVGGVYLFVFAPVIAAAEGRSMPECMARSIRAARLPGAGNLSMSALYVIPSVALLVAPGKPGSSIGVNPSVAAWAFAILTNVLHLALTAAFAFRYLSIAAEVPEPARPQSRTRGRS